MGEVYRGRDTRLDRSVAIKILPAHYSSDRNHKQRFEREAKAISGLNHPNICTLHDVGSQDGIDYLVMECVEGQSLAQRLEKGPLPIEQVLKIGREIADALAAAHRSGIIHRDLKPGNIILTKSGAKLLDFGLAKWAAQTCSLATMSASASVELPVTEEGTIVGTFQYMSPEQIEGKELDGRSDVFSLGAVLYEMLTGQRAFQGKSQLSVASAILEKEPLPIRATKPLAPRSLDHVIRRCLAKDSEERWQTTRDLALELKSIEAEDPDSSEGLVNGVVRRANVYAWIGLCLAGFLLASTLFLLSRLRLKGRVSQETIRSSILPPEGRELDRWGAAAISPDGKYLVFSAIIPGWGGQLYLRRVDSILAKPLPGTEGAQTPFWSPDSKWIGFVAGAKLRKVSVEGGSPLILCDSSQLRGASWSSNGTILFVPGAGNPVFSVSEAGGSPVAVTQLDKSAGEVTHRWPIFLPDGKHFLFFSRGRENAIYASTIDSKERKLIVSNDTNVLYASPGFLLYVKNGALMAQRFDAKRLELSGSPAAIVDGVPVFGGQQHGLFTVSENGILAIQSKEEMISQPVWVDQVGKSLEPLMEPAMFAMFDMRMAPDRRKIAFGITDPKDGVDNIWVHDAANHQTTRLTFEQLIAQHPIWAPDGSQVLYTSNRIGHPQIFRIPTTGVGEAEPFLPSDYSDVAESWSPDGRYLAFGRAPIEGMVERSLWILPLFGEKKPYPLLPGSHSQQWSGVFSPDGKWMAFVSIESGKGETYIVPFPSVHMKIQISKNGGSRPHWSRDGHQLFYIGQGHALMEATLRFAPGGIQVANTQTLFRLDIPEFEISGDGRRFLVFKTVDNQEPSTVTLISNWTNLLPR